MKQARALVTGGAGFLGPHLIQALLEHGWRVLAVDDFRNGQPQHVEQFQGHHAFEFCQGDVTVSTFAERMVAEFVPQVVFHLAALHFIPYCMAHPSEALAVNVLGTQRLLDAIMHAPVECFILASTADVYAASNTPHRETDLLGSTNIYGVSKLCCEQLLQLARVRHPQTRFLAARLTNIFGPGETNPHVLPEIFESLRHGNVLRLGNLSPKRDYVYVTDVAHALILLAAYQGAETVFNVSTGRGTSVSELVEALERVLDRKVRVAVDPAKVRKIERQHLVSDISLIQHEAGWAPLISLEEGLHRTLMAEQRLAAAVAQNV